MGKNSDEALAKALQRCDEALSKMTPGLRAEVEDLRELANQLNRSIIDYHYRLGERVAKICKAAQAYGPDGVRLLPKAMLMHRETLEKALELYEWKPNQQALEELTSKRGPQGRALSWGHIALILTLAPEMRDEVVQSTLANCWTVLELVKEIRLRQWRRSRPEEKLLTPKSIFGGLVQVTTMATRLVDRLRSAFAQVALKPLEKLDGQATNLTVLTQTESARTALLCLIEEATEHAEALAPLEDKVRVALFGDPEVALDADELPVIKVPPAPGSARNAGRAPA
jgi:hypothetical protein